ncbi:uncharacterized protein LOC129601307 [Paramacrobiotus metropolitanus]|uniref:uncharacterized protein LOC129601307 n=1 Tax=Paramacrobiotus metropolitanus TaxID=2943436 RepID=UPI002445C9CA|nr:uncharacterized protein LOC129601307 [Paramacrobiotus metropolitanus]
MQVGCSLVYFLFQWFMLPVATTGMEKSQNHDLFIYMRQNGPYYAVRPDRRLHYEVESVRRGDPSRSSIYRFPLANIGQKFPGVGYPEYYTRKSMYRAGRPGQGHLPVLGYRATGGISLQQPLYGSLYGDTVYDGPMHHPLPESTSTTTVASTTQFGNQTSDAPPSCPPNSEPGCFPIRAWCDPRFDRCPNVPGAQCVVDCDNCGRWWYLNGQDVTRWCRTRSG